MSPVVVTKEMNIKDFAKRVERLCDYLLNKTEKDGSRDRKVIEELKEDSADIQFDRIRLISDQKTLFEGLHNFMNGVDNESSPRSG